VFNTVADRNAYSPAVGQIAYVLDDGSGYNAVYIVAQTTPSIIWVPINVAPGATNVGGNPDLGEKTYLNTLSKQFAYNTASPSLLGNILVGSTVTSVDVVVTTAFDDVASTVSVGTDADPLQFMTTDMVYTDEEATYINDQKQTVITTTAAKVFISPGTSTQGEIAVTITYR